MKRVLRAWIAVGIVTLWAPAVAASSVTSVLGGQTISGSAIPCATQSDGVRVCHGADGGGSSDLRLKSFDGSPLEVYVILPPAPSTGADGGYPLVIQSHGWGGSAGGPETGLATSKAYSGPTADNWAARGYAVVQLTARGFNDSCGSAASRLVAPSACTNGYIRLDDDRYEIRDAQYAAGLLVDAGIADPARVGATGPSYGGGVSLALATLKDRMIATDGSAKPWTSPNGTSLHLSAAAPVIPWSDLAYALTPNGRTLDYEVTSPTADVSPAGVAKQSFIAGLYALGGLSGYYAPPLSNPEADLTTWFGVINAGEPYDGNPKVQQIASELTRFHSAYYLLDGVYGVPSEPPSPLLIANGFTDDLFPVDEALRYYNLERSLYPSDPIALFDFDGGHQRGQNKDADQQLLAQRISAFFDHYVRGSGPQPPLGATALTQTCPSTAPSGGPFSAPTWAGLHPGEVDYSSAPSKTVLSSAGNPAVAKAIDPITGGGACATASAADQGSGVATYRLPAVTGAGYTLLGSPTVLANLSVTGAFAEIAARLWDVDPATDTETLVARGVYRIDASKPDGLQLFQLHPGAWHFAAGHIPKLELLGQDAPYARASNGSFSIDVSDLQLRLPVHEQPGSAPSVTRPSAVVAPKPHSCVALPTSKVIRRRITRRGLIVQGRAGERACSSAPLAIRRREKVARVYVTIYRPLGHGHCRFMRAAGTLTGRRSCRRPIWLLARGTTRWRLEVRTSVARGFYLIRSDAVDGLHHRQRQNV